MSYLARLKKHTFGLVGIVLALLAAAPSSRAQNVVFGLTLPLSGQLADAGQSARRGVQAYIARVNREGGVGGRQIALDVRDDAYDPRKFEANIKQFVDEGRVEAVILGAGTSNIANAYPLLAKAGLPMVGALTGASLLRDADHLLIHEAN